MRLSPKSVFLGLLLLGLPFAVVVGWQLADREPATASALYAPAGAGGLGAAPTHTTAPARPRIDRPALSEPTATPAAATPTPPAIVPTTTTPAAATTLPTAGIPVPTPTDVPSTSPSASPSPSPSESKEPELPLFDQAHWWVTP